MTELERIDRDLAEASKRLAKAERAYDYETVTIYTAEIDRLLDKRNRVERTMIEA